VSTDDKISPAEQPPALEELAKKYFWDFLWRKFGPSGAVIIFVIVTSVLYFRSEIEEGVSRLHAQVVQWWPLPKAKPDIFTVAIARLEGDNEKGDMGSTITQDLRDLDKSYGIAVLEFPRAITADSDDDG
jgi:hypothetical protein